jgi:hypothetical protein
LQAVREAVQYPGYVQIGIRLSSAYEAADLIKASGKELQVFEKQISGEEWDKVLQLSPDFVGTDYYLDLLKCLR